MINALFDLLGTFYQSGEFAQAEWMARSILQAIPDDLVSLQLLGLVYYRTRRRSEAMQAFSAAEGDVHTGPPAACMPRRSACRLPAAMARPWPEPGMSLDCCCSACDASHRRSAPCRQRFPRAPIFVRRSALLHASQG